MSSNHEDEDDDGINAMRARLQEMEAERAKIMEMTKASHSAAPVAGSPAVAPAQTSQGQATEDETGDASMTEEEREAIDSRSIYVGNVDYGATPEELQQLFKDCGTINRVTILCDKFTRHPKGFAYVEFSEPTFVANAISMNETLFRGRMILVKAKRTNVPGMSARGRGRGRARGYRGGGRGGYYGYDPYYRPRGRGRGRGAAF
ncbi:uncharacterized protein L969DRAFT_91003 [Mixia osmundae IAM 14324]|uniref:RRM domain-containing protein n=1 Tax=Mixia osmundae (strain CBS 9802 / IAM 14324 / JCM 22182 / KY 12970) TaxID=764103 RepID=G7E546_MIXOS|nr:uncharacterized protein L969DRAFT_91003 [Mixia osmundae IAM 14324]KEI36357.1 hypothetical protein L969DRAFT_91003 [Mixia osmundae IAM 14324]GAA97956.1 hypothetical protein E5Q_04636 [Mixia osmundae IAM 14324]